MSTGGGYGGGRGGRYPESMFRYARIPIEVLTLEDKNESTNLIKSPSVKSGMKMISPEPTYKRNLASTASKTSTAS